MGQQLAKPVELIVPKILLNVRQLWERIREVLETD